MEREDFGEDPDIDKLIFGATAWLIYNNLIRRCKDHVASLAKVTFDPVTGKRQYIFNGKVERTTFVRGISGHPPIQKE